MTALLADPFDIRLRQRWDAFARVLGARVNRTGRHCFAIRPRSRFSFVFRWRGAHSRRLPVLRYCRCLFFARMGRWIIGPDSHGSRPSKKGARPGAAARNPSCRTTSGPRCDMKDFECGDRRFSSSPACRRSQPHSRQASGCEGLHPRGQPRRSNRDRQSRRCW
jgi:hypothetical protein